MWGSVPTLTASGPRQYGHSCSGDETYDVGLWHMGSICQVRRAANGGTACPPVFSKRLITFSAVGSRANQKGIKWDVSLNGGTPKSSILIGISNINHSFGVALFLETPLTGGYFFPMAPGRWRFTTFRLWDQLWHFHQNCSAKVWLATCSQSFPWHLQWKSNS